MSKADLMPVSEIFGPTVQGEGRSLGVPAIFVRLGGCNLACDWCDTPYTWDWTRFEAKKEIRMLTQQQVTRHVLDLRGDAAVSLVVITGGEPMLQQKRLPDVLNVLSAYGFRVEIETAGTIAPAGFSMFGAHYTVSPKLAHSGNPREKAIRPHVLRDFALMGDKVTFKFVVKEPSDFEEVDDLMGEGPLFDVPHSRVYIMPEGTDPKELAQRTREILPEVYKRGYRLTPRLHVSLWGDARGY